MNEAETQIALDTLSRRIDELQQGMGRSGLSSIGHRAEHGIDFHVPRNNWSATAAPGVTDDSGDGYGVGSEWIDTTNDKAYKCLDATAGAAVWTETTGGAHGAASHTDRERHVWVPAQQFSLLAGTPALVQFGTSPDRYEGWAMDGASTEAVHTYFTIPHDYVDLTGGNLYIVWTRNAAGSGNIKWQTTVLLDALEVGGTDLTSAGTSTTVTVAVPTANEVKYTGSNQQAATFLAARLVRLTVERLGGDAADTFNNLDAIFLGVLFEYNADS